MTLRPALAVVSAGFSPAGPALSCLEDISGDLSYMGPHTRPFETESHSHRQDASVADAIRAGRTDYQTVTRFPDQYTQKLCAAVHRLKHKHTATP